MGTEQAAGQRPVVFLPDGVSEAGQSKAASRAGRAGSGAAVASAQSWSCALPLSPMVLGGCAGHLAGHAAWVNPTLSLALA